MARSHIWQYLLNREGQPIEGATIQVYLAGSNEYQATIYHQEDGGSPDAVGQITTLSNGFFEFWIANLDEDGGYASDQKVRIAWDKPGIVKGYIDHVDVFDEGIDYYPVDVKDNSQTKDRVVSNYYANIWTEHATGTGYNDGAHNIYSIVDDSTDTIRNKLVSNSHLNTLNLNTEFLSSTIDSLEADTIYLSGAIDYNDIDITNLYNDTVYLSATIDTNINDITNLYNDTVYLSATIDTNINDITNLEADTLFLSGNVDKNIYDISILETDLSYWSKEITANTTDVVSLSAEIDTSNGNIFNNTAEIYELSATYIPLPVSASEMTEGEILSWSEATSAWENTHNVGYLKFNPQTIVPVEEGTLYYSNITKTFNIYNDIADTTLNVGHELVTRVINTTNSIIPNGTVVYITGMETVYNPELSGNIHIPAVSAAISNVFFSSRAAGIATHDIAVSAQGLITTNGIVHDMDTSSWNPSDTLFISPSAAGSYVVNDPQPPNISLPVAMVMNSHATSGSILVRIGYPVKLAVGDEDGAIQFKNGYGLNASSYFNFDDNSHTLGLSGTLKVTGDGIFTEPITGATPILDNHLTTKVYVDDNTYSTSQILYPTNTTNPGLVTVQDYFNHVMSATPISGSNIIDNGNGTVTISTGTALLRTGTDIYTTNLIEFDIPSGTTGTGLLNPLVDNSTNYIFADWNMGAIRLTCETYIPNESGYTKVPLWIINRVGNNLYIVDMREYGLNYQSNNSRKDFFVNGHEHQPGGTTLTESISADLALNLTSGIFYLSNLKRFHKSFDTGGIDTFTELYRSATPGQWTRVINRTIIDNSHYDDGDGTLGLMTGGYYGVHWIYLIVEGDDSTLHSVYGQAQYPTLSDAQAAETPGELPPEATGVGSQLVGKIILLKNASTFTEIQSPFIQILGTSNPVLHNGLGGIQGGASNEYYHLTASELLNVQSLSGNATTITAVDESADTSCYVAYFNDPEGAQQIRTGTNLTFNSLIGTLTTVTFAGNLTGNASTATALETSRTISLTGDVTGTSVGFNGTSNLSFATIVGDNSHNHTTTTISSLDAGDVTTGTFVTTLIPTNINITGNSGTATALETPRTIGGNSFNGTSNITVSTATAGFAVTGDITATGNITAYFSDMRLKDKISNIDNALDKISMLNGFYYKANDIARSYGYISDEIEVGISAQEVESIMPHVIKPAPFDIYKDEDTGEISSKSGENYLTVQYEKLVPLLIESIKELNDKVKVLEEKLENK